MALVALVACGGATRAQTTQPADAQPATPAPPVRTEVVAPLIARPTWQGTVEQLARGTEVGDVPQVIAALAQDAAVRSFDRPDAAAAARNLVDAAADWKLLGAHAYEFPPPSLAGDVAADVMKSTSVSTDDKRKIVPFNDSELARANQTAADWVAQTLGAERDHLVGVAVFWNTLSNRPMFILVKGDRSGDGYAVKLAVYGDPMIRSRATAAAR